MQSFHNNRLLYACLLHARLLHGCDVTHISSIGRFATSISLREHANERYAECLEMNLCSKNDLFTEIDNFIEVYNNSVIELIPCFGTSFFGRIVHLASSVITSRPNNSVPKHCIRSITYNNYGINYLDQFSVECIEITQDLTIANIGQIEASISSKISHEDKFADEGGSHVKGTTPTR